jgi:hypothetical protein
MFSLLIGASLGASLSTVRPSLMPAIKAKRHTGRVEFGDPKNVAGVKPRPGLIVPR